MQSLFLIQLILKSIFLRCFPIPLRFSHSLLRRRRASPVCEVKLPERVYIDMYFYLHPHGIDKWIRTKDQKFMKPDGTRDINDRFTDENNLDFDSEEKKRCETGRRRAPVVPFDAHLLLEMSSKFFPTFCTFRTIFL